MNNLGDILKNYISVGKFDEEGREIGYATEVSNNGIKFHALVQTARRINGEWVRFDIARTSKSFGSQFEARGWARNYALNKAVAV